MWGDHGKPFQEQYRVIIKKHLMADAKQVIQVSYAKSRASYKNPIIETFYLNKHGGIIHDLEQLFHLVVGQVISYIDIIWTGWAHNLKNLGKRTYVDMVLKNSEIF